MDKLRIEGAASTKVAEVTDNEELSIAFGTTPATAGYFLDKSEKDVGTHTLEPYLKDPETSADHRRSFGMGTCLFNYAFIGTTQDTGVWKHNFATMTMTQGGGFLLCNTNLSAAAANGCALQSWRYFPLFRTAPLSVTFTRAITAIPQANQMLELGLFTTAVGAIAPTEGVYFRLTSVGVVGILNFNGVEISTEILKKSEALRVGVAVNYTIVVGEREVEFWGADELLGEISVPEGNAQTFMTDCLPIGIQQRNVGTVIGAPQMEAKIGSVLVTLVDVASGKPWAYQMSGMGRSHQGLAGGTMGALAKITNSQANGTGTALSNTAPNAVFTGGLGGQFGYLPTLTASNDGIICSFQNPVGSATQPPRNLVIHGVHIHSSVTTALTGGPVYAAYTLAFGHTAVSAATVETGSFVNATTRIPRRIPLGWETFVVTAAVGATGQGIHAYFSTPIVVAPGLFVAVLLKNVGTVTTLGVINVVIGFDHFFE